MTHTCKNITFPQTLFAGGKNCTYASAKREKGCPLWFSNPEETSPEVRNRGISGPKMDMCPGKNFKKKLNYTTARSDRSDKFAYCQRSGCRLKVSLLLFYLLFPDFVRIQLVFQLVNLGQPYDLCKKNAPPIATCLQECKKKAAEVKCGCSDTMDTFPDNITMTTCDVLGTLCNLKLRGTCIFL